MTILGIEANLFVSCVGGAAGLAIVAIAVLKGRMGQPCRPKPRMRPVTSRRWG
ncbi:MAG: hypothetical protein PHT12_01100 [Patescibacteria group bacterium]|nr:hypothetical protein [Patescibacteria group bacterium]